MAESEEAASPVSDEAVLPLHQVLPFWPWTSVVKTLLDTLLDG